MVIISLPGLCQEDDVTRPEDLEQRVHVLGSPAPSDTSANPHQNQNPPTEVTEDDELMIQNLEAEKRRQAETAQKLDQAKNALTDPIFNAPEELKKLGHEQITAASLLDDKVIRIIKKMFDQNALKNVSDEEVKSMILEKAKGSYAERFLKKNPRILMMFVDILKDEKAMSSAVGIFLRKSDLKIYGLIWLFLVILSWLIKKYAFNEDWSGGKRFLMSLALSLCVTATSLTIFYNMFYEEISPITKIIVKHWKK